VENKNALGSAYLESLNPTVSQDKAIKMSVPL
jgi:hypothetical protein